MFLSVLSTLKLCKHQFNAEEKALYQRDIFYDKTIFVLNDHIHISRTIDTKVLFCLATTLVVLLA